MTKRSWEDIGYREALESCGSWNAQMLRGRKHRVPYFDSHTNIGQVFKITSTLAGSDKISFLNEIFLAKLSITC